eukprot:TRINITY_DN35440_c1_g1_i1.p1 TRINITY_DN35440_c1_g1~~TRINITY_DN35440_c1_g1_i1.p1  ORF type:complete len:101 (-),score=4.73 TRINITY_DN35440_c1_g1_i1:471-773(-)
MRAFSDWINLHSLVDIHLAGALYTWLNHQSPPIMSKLDRFLVNNDWIDLYLGVNQCALPKPASDHFPIILHSKCERWGPTPFRFELIWLEEKNLTSQIKG